MLTSEEQNRCGPRSYAEPGQGGYLRAGASSRATESSRWSERTHAAFHSDLVMCVAFSQNPTQSSRVLPPPPAMLGNASLGLLLNGVEELSVAGFPALKSWGATGCDSGAIASKRSAGEATAELGAGAAVVGWAGGTTAFRSVPTEP
jgi:hypothetical protein